MRSLTEQNIRTRAYKLWQAAGEPNIRFDAFWYQAEKELLEERTRETAKSGRSKAGTRRIVRRRDGASARAH
ncbi:DUF2934 family protein [Bradyrhizobium macuxiense]|uniref:DUF2934 family protein n=1 Tax=Bradyrhizobium macuxiense TaxID=1755647 RepID=A0A560L629_9BRAD|nr:DUF2934 domain-containing protein [Bradyrhizobium macuxiense]TWB89954.1 DUF2934 family protein [Bradyrhizobium macuxiense]